MCSFFVEFNKIIVSHTFFGVRFVRAAAAFCKVSLLVSLYSRLVSNTVKHGNNIIVVSVNEKIIPFIMS